MAAAAKLVLILVLVGLNAFFVAAEYAIVTVRRTRLEHLARAGNPTARVVQALLGDVTLLFSATQLGVTVASVLMGWLGEGIIAELIQSALRGRVRGLASAAVSHSVAVVIAFLLVTGILMVLGELVPKTIAYERADRIALITARPLSFFLKLSKVPVRVLDRMAAGVLRAIGHLPGKTLGGLHTPEELKLLVSAVRRGGLLGEHQEEMIHSVFDLHRVFVREIMVPRPRVTTLAYTEDFRLLLNRIALTQHSRIPVYDGSEDHIVGILHTRDLVRPLLDRLEGKLPLDARLDLRPILREPMIVPETMPLNQMLDEAGRKHSQMALVVDEFGTFAGLVTIDDVIEQIVGELHDERDTEETVSFRISDNVVVLDGSVTLRELADTLEIVLPRGAGYETLAGFVLAHLGTIPKGGETCVFEGRRYTVAEMAGRRVAKVTIEKIPAVSPAPDLAAIKAKQ